MNAPDKLDKVVGKPKPMGTRTPSEAFDNEWQYDAGAA